jgi:hypothetical protein
MRTAPYLTVIVGLWADAGFLRVSFRAEFQDFARLALERLANGFEGGKTDGPGLAGSD